MNEKFIPVAKPILGEEEAQAARRVILSGWVVQGPEVAGLEREFAEFVGAPYACAVSNCTTALHLAMLIMGIGPGDEVITVSHSFIATANSIRFCGATPVFVDIDPTTYNMDPALIEAAITPKTRGILCVHQMGMPCDLAAIMPIAKKHGIFLVEDAACASGSEILWNGQWDKIGKPHADMACFSLHPRKLVTTGEGGMITTTNAEWDRRLRILRHQGMSVTDTVRHSSKQVIFEDYDEVGYNYRMCDIQAAVGREQLKRLPYIVESRRALGSRYMTLLADIPGIKLPFEPDWARTNWQCFCIGLPDGCDQRTVMQRMLDNNIATRRAVMCSHREKSYADLPLRFPLPMSEKVQDNYIMLPLFSQMTDEDQILVVETLKRAVSC